MIDLRTETAIALADRVVELHLEDGDLSSLAAVMAKTDVSWPHLAGAILGHLDLALTRLAEVLDVDKGEAWAQLARSERM